MSSYEKLNNSKEYVGKDSPVFTNSISLGRKVDIIMGSNSTAFGNDVIACGIASHAEGLNTIARGVASHAEGNGTNQQMKIEVIVYASENWGEYIIEDYHGPHIIPAVDCLELINSQNGSFNIVPITRVFYKNDTTAIIELDLPEIIPSFQAYLICGGAIGSASHTEGSFTTAGGDSSHAEGNESIAKGVASHAEGYQTKASGDCAHTEGMNTTATGSSGHAEGFYTVANGDSSHAEGELTNAEGLNSHAEGSGTLAKGRESHAEGYQNKIQVQVYAGENYGTYIVSDYPDSHSISQDDHLEIINAEDGSFSVVPIISATEKDDGTTIIELDLPEVIQNFLAFLICGGAIGSSSHSEGNSTLAKGDYSHSEGRFTAANGESSHAEGEETVANGTASHAEGTGSLAEGHYSHAEGYQTTANEEGSHAEGYQTIASERGAHAEGIDATASDFGSHAEGINTTASGQAAHAEGQSTTAGKSGAHAEGAGTIASGLYSHAEGYQTTASDESAHAEGKGTIARSFSQHVQGKYNIEDLIGEYSHIVGNGSSYVRKNAHTLDWSGNAWFSGNVYVGSTSGTNKDEGSQKLATEKYVDENGGVFIAEYGVTTEEELIKAYEDKKTIFVKYIDKNGSAVFAPSSVIMNGSSGIYLQAYTMHTSPFSNTAEVGQFYFFSYISEWNVQSFSLSSGQHAKNHTPGGFDELYSYGSIDLDENSSALEEGKLYFVIS